MNISISRLPVKWKLLMFPHPRFYMSKSRWDCNSCPHNIALYSGFNYFETFARVWWVCWSSDCCRSDIFPQSPETLGSVLLSYSFPILSFSFDFSILGNCPWNSPPSWFLGLLISHDVFTSFQPGLLWPIIWEILNSTVHCLTYSRLPAALNSGVTQGPPVSDHLTSCHSSPTCASFLHSVGSVTPVLILSSFFLFSPQPSVIWLLSYHSHEAASPWVQMSLLLLLVFKNLGH